MTQQEALLTQARSDYSVFELLHARDRGDVPECHVLHYFQMATEKLAKAVLARTRGHAGMTHIAFTWLAGHLERRPDILRAIGYTDPSNMRRFLARSRPLFRQIEMLCPSVAAQEAGAAGLHREQGRNVEYPWRATSAAHEQVWLAPAGESFAAYQTITLRSGDGLAMMTLVRNLLAHYDRLP